MSSVKSNKPFRRGNMRFVPETSCADIKHPNQSHWNLPIYGGMSANSLLKYTRHRFVHLYRSTVLRRKRSLTVPRSLRTGPLGRKQTWRQTWDRVDPPDIPQEPPLPPAQGLV